MAAILGGLGAAVAWASTTLCSSRSTRMVGAASVVAWTALIGLALTIPLLIAAGNPHLGPREITLLAIGGAGNIGGLLLSYTALRDGPVGLVAPIVSAEGAVAAAIAIAGGDSVTTGTLIALLVVAVGVVLAGAVRSEHVADERHTAAILFAGGAALSFGASLYATGRIGHTLPVAWAVLPPRLVGVVVIAAPLIAARRLRLTRPALPLLAASGATEVLGFAAFAAGARHDVAIAAVLASLFGAVAALVARVLFAERLTRPQVTGVTVIIAGVVALGVLQI
jgi:drug/metabolite transporter (DMT)-like permease